MLFNSYEFIFLFLPITLLLFHLLRKSQNKRVILLGFIAISLFFYGWWAPKNLILIAASISINYWIARLIYRTQNKLYLIIGISLNLGALIYYKYMGYFLNFLMVDTAIPNVFRDITLPLAISFFTFQQISYLMDIWQKKVIPENFSEYTLCVLFFPHLIAGPIIRYQDIYSQFKTFWTKNSITIEHYVVGFTIFMLGLFKKTGIADTLIPYVEKIFLHAERGYEVGLLDGWMGALAYTFQLYFDFSGYSDMAIGLAYMFGILLPMNFNSPYKAINLIEFWRRWHMSLSAFFRDYLYISMGGNRVHVTRKFLNLILVMGIVGLWHGAGNTFVLWGLYHGILLVLNHIFVLICNRKKDSLFALLRQVCPKALSWFATFFAVVLGWVMFRAKDLSIAKAMYFGMFGKYKLYGSGFALIDERNYYSGFCIIALCVLISVLCPNTCELMSRWKIVLSQDKILKDNSASLISIQWKINMMFAMFMGVLAYFALTNLYSIKTEFLYFNF